MSERANPLQPDFSTADAEYPDFSLRDGVLELEFTDWREEPVRVRFTNAVGVKWQELDSAGPEDEDDGVFEIAGSAWLAAYLAAGVRGADEGLRHFRLCFNPIGVLDVLASAMERERG